MPLEKSGGWNRESERLHFHVKRTKCHPRETYGIRFAASVAPHRVQDELLPPNQVDRQLKTIARDRESICQLNFEWTVNRNFGP